MRTDGSHVVGVAPSGGWACMGSKPAVLPVQETCLGPKPSIYKESSFCVAPPLALLGISPQAEMVVKRKTSEEQQVGDAATPVDDEATVEIIPLGAGQEVGRSCIILRYM